MHYKNGTPAQDGDAVILQSYPQPPGKIVAGVLHSTIPGCTSCNGQVAVPVPGGISNQCITVGNLYSAADAFRAMEALVVIRERLRTEAIAGISSPPWMDEILKGPFFDRGMKA